MKHIRTFVLPIAIILGLLFHKECHYLKVIVPTLIFTILLLNFVAVDVKKLRINMMSVWLMLFQVGVSVGTYFLLSALNVNEIVAEGILAGVICPVAASVVVIACMLGADRETVTSYTIVDNIMLAFVIPICFSFIGTHQDIPFIKSFLLILSKVGTTIGLPFVVALLLQLVLPKVNTFLNKYSGASFYIWAVALCITLGQTIDFIFIHGKGNGSSILALGVASIIFCIIQFGFGKWIGHKYGDTMAGGQLMGQKNTAMGIWIANTYLNPLASVYLALYSIWQNLFNSWQLWRHDKSKAEK